VGYWARLDANQEIVDNDIVESGLSLMNVAPTDAYVEMSGAAVALVDLPWVDPIAEGWTDGTYLVGTDIAPGRYNITPAGSSAYFARLDANLGIIDNNISEGNVIAVVDRPTGRCRPPALSRRCTDGTARRVQPAVDQRDATRSGQVIERPGRRAWLPARCTG